MAESDDVLKEEYAVVVKVLRWLVLGWQRVNS
jgi:hypothetical protein